MVVNDFRVSMIIVAWANSGIIDGESPALLFPETAARLPVTKGDMVEYLNGCDKLSHIFCTQELLSSQYLSTAEMSRPEIIGDRRKGW